MVTPTLYPRIINTRKISRYIFGHNAQRYNFIAYPYFDAFALFALFALFMEGEKNGLRKVVLNLKAQGMPLDEISKVTGLPMEEIQSI